MYDINEIKLQNKFDIWAIVYLHLAKELVAACGRNGEGAVRDGIRRLGAAEGKRLRELHLSQGIKTNLLSLYDSCTHCVKDPRVRKKVLTHSPEVELFEIYTCPAADLWNKRGEGKTGSFFCEEYQYALVGEYTKNRGQRNLSMELTCPRDNDCRFSMYYRAANVDAATREVSFGDSAAASPLETDDERLCRMTIDTVRYMLEAACERFGSEGECAIANGLRAAAKEIIPFCAKKADDTRGRCDAEFLKLNFPVALDCSDEGWKGADRARELFGTHIIGALKREFSLA